MADATPPPSALDHLLKNARTIAAKKREEHDTREQKRKKPDNDEKERIRYLKNETELNSILDVAAARGPYVQAAGLGLEVGLFRP